MNAILGMTQLALREDDSSDTMREYLTTTRQAGVNLLSLINDILDFSKIESGAMQIIPSAYLFSSLINDVISIIKARLIDTPVRFVVNVDSNIPNELVGDEPKIRQVLINLLGNAAKFTDEGYVSLTITGEKADDDIINLSIKVADSGRGMKQEDVGKLFHEYFQLDYASNTHSEGVGLGLAITSSILKAMDGAISVKSELGKGSTFTVTFPQKIHSHERLAFVEAPDEKASLLYESHFISASSIRYAITNLGVNCDAILDDDQFNKMIKQKVYPYIFLPYKLYERNKGEILKNCGDSQIVLLTEFGESTPIGNWKAISAPFHVISIANIFNGILNRSSYASHDETSIIHTAPNAKVLVVDDIKTNLKVASGLLAPYKMNVFTCESGQEAINAVKSKDFDIVFMDHRMPGMDGVEATQHIRALESEDPYFRELPIVALTANAVSGMEEMFLSNGFSDFLSKPIDTDKLNTIIERWILRAS